MKRAFMIIMSLVVLITGLPQAYGQVSPAEQNTLTQTVEVQTPVSLGPPPVTRNPLGGIPE